MKWKIFILLFCIGSVAGLMTFTSCGDEKLDPCRNRAKVAPDFTIGEYITNSGNVPVDTVVVTDTVLMFNEIIFEADSDYLSYEWTIGEDSRVFTTKRVSLLFTTPVSDITVRLIVKWKPQALCFPDDDGVDNDLS